MPVYKRVTLTTICVVWLCSLVNAQSRAKDGSNICGFFLGMGQMTAISVAQEQSLGHLEPKSQYPAYDMLPLNRGPLLIAYGEDFRVRWVSGPSLQTEKGLTLSSSDSIADVRKKFGSKLLEVTDEEILCDGSVQGFKVEPDLLISVLPDDRLVFSLGPRDGWKIARGHGISWEQLSQISKAPSRR